MRSIAEGGLQCQGKITVVYTEHRDFGFYSAYREFHDCGYIDRCAANKERIQGIKQNILPLKTYVTKHLFKT